MQDQDSTDAGSFVMDVPFGMIPEWVIFHDELSPGAVRAYAALSRYANGEKAAWPGKETLADRLGVAKSTVERWLMELRQVGALTSEARYREDGGQTSSRYTLTTREPGEGSPSVGRGGHREQGGGRPTDRARTKAIERKPLNETERPMLVAVASEPLPQGPGFDEFWNAFGLKSGKAEARKAWAKAVKVTDPEDIIAGAERYREWLEGHPSPPHQKWAQGWLNGRRWEDELEPYPKGKQNKFEQAVDAVQQGRQMREQGVRFF